MDACVVTVNVALAAVLPEIAEGAETEQVGVEARFDGVTAHVSATFPLKPLLGVIQTVEVAAEPGSIGAGVEPLSTKLGVSLPGAVPLVRVMVAEVPW